MNEYSNIIPFPTYKGPIWEDEKEVKPRRDWNPHHVHFGRGFLIGAGLVGLAWLIREIVR